MPVDKGGVLEPGYDWQKETVAELYLRHYDEDVASKQQMGITLVCEGAGDGETGNGDGDDPQSCSGENGQDGQNAANMTRPGDVNTGFDTHLAPTPHDQRYPEDLARKWTDATVEAIEAAKLCGSVPAGMESHVRGLIKPDIPWYNVLREILVRDRQGDDALDWGRPRHHMMRRLGGNVFIPRSRGERTPPLAIAMDASGSVSNEEFAAFSSNVVSLCQEMKPEKVFACQFESVISNWKVFDDVGDLEEITRWVTHRTGYGGTSFQCVYNWVGKHILSEGHDLLGLIIFTDMYAPFGNDPSDYRVYWIATSDLEAPFGTTIRLRVHNRT